MTLELQQPEADLNYGWRVHDFATRELAEDKPHNLLVGAVRSGKTWALHPKIIHASSTRSTIRGWRVLVGQTKDTIYTNVLKDLFDLVGENNYSYSAHTGRLQIFDMEWKVLGARDEGSEKFVRGATIGVAVCDEVVLMPETFFKMLLTRLSPPGARFYGTTNPDNPMHWLKQEYIDNPRVQQDWFHMAMNMEDNPNLTQDYIERQKRSYTGMFFQRFILGLWVMASGAIWGDAWSDALLYDDSTRPLGLTARGGHKERWISNDYGTDHPHVYLDYYDDGDTIWVDNEFVWDSKESMRQKTDEEYVKDLMEFMGQNRGCEVIIPPEALSFRAACVQKGIWVTKAKNEHEGLKSVATMMSKKKLRIHKRCTRLIRGIQAHVWDPNKSKRGVEEPLKQNDDEADCLRYGIHTKVPAWRLSSAA